MCTLLKENLSLGMLGWPANLRWYWLWLYKLFLKSISKQNDLFLKALNCPLHFWGPWLITYPLFLTLDKKGFNSVTRYKLCSNKLMFITLKSG